MKLLPMKPHPPVTITARMKSLARNKGIIGTADDNPPRTISVTPSGSQENELMNDHGTKKSWAKAMVWPFLSPGLGTNCAPPFSRGGNSFVVRWPLRLPSAFPVHRLKVLDPAIQTTIFSYEFFPNPPDFVDDHIVPHDYRLRSACPRLAFGMDSGETSKGTRNDSWRHILSNFSWAIGLTR
jgi:hypothetical protein